MTAKSARGADVLAGNFTKREEFDGPLGPEWITVHVPNQESGPTIGGDVLLLSARPGITLADKRHASFLARRQHRARAWQRYI